MDQAQEQMRFAVHFFHYEKTVGASEEICAALLGFDLDAFRKIKTEFAYSVRQAAEELLADPAFIQAVDRLPFKPGAVVVGLGDSITDDYTSWCEILREVLSMHRPKDGIRVVNAGISGQTTTEVLARFLDVANLNPDWVIAMIGTNDGLHGLKPQKNLVSFEETEKITAPPSFANEQTRPLVLDDSPCDRDEDRGGSFVSAQLMWRNDDLRARANVLLSMPDPVVDLQAAFEPLNPAWLLDDGLHPSLDGQKIILRAMVEKLGISRDR
jgi:lysophospholipase L1-like esterase